MKFNSRMSILFKKKFHEIRNLSIQILNYLIDFLIDSVEQRKNESILIRHIDCSWLNLEYSLRCFHIQVLFNSQININIIKNV